MGRNAASNRPGSLRLESERFELKCPLSPARRAAFDSGATQAGARAMLPRRCFKRRPATPGGAADRVRTSGAAGLRLRRLSYRRPPPTVAPFGIAVDPLGEVLMKLLPEGFSTLLAPAAALPALLPRFPPALPVVVPLAAGAPAPLAAGAPAVELPAAVPLPLWANAIVLESASAVANPIAVSFIAASFHRSRPAKAVTRLHVPIPIFTISKEVAFALSHLPRRPSLANFMSSPFAWRFNGMRADEWFGRERRLASVVYL
jgi:hypothetical protein